MDPRYFNQLAGIANQDPEAYADAFSGCDDFVSGAFSGPSVNAYELSPEVAARVLLAQNAQAAALMGLNLNPFSWAKKIAQGTSRALYNVTRGKRPWAPVGPSGRPLSPTVARQAALRRLNPQGYPPPTSPDGPAYDLPPGAQYAQPAGGANVDPYTGLPVDEYGMPQLDPYGMPPPGFMGGR